MSLLLHATCEHYTLRVLIRLTQVLVKGYFHSTTLMHSLRSGFFSPRQNSARMGRGFTLALGFRALVRRFAAADMVATAPVAASAVFQAELSGLSVEGRGVVLTAWSGALLSGCCLCRGDESERDRCSGDVGRVVAALAQR